MRVVGRSRWSFVNMGRWGQRPSQIVFSTSTGFALLRHCQNSGRRYSAREMSALETIVEELKTLPPASLKAAAGYVHQLKLASVADRRRALDGAFGCLSAAEAEDLERAVQSNCERIDAGQW